MSNSNHEAQPSARIAAFVACVVRILDAKKSSSDRREATLKLLVDSFEADKAHWAWGRGDASGKIVSPLGIIMVGYEDNERIEFQRMATHPRMEQEFRQPIVRRMGNRLRDSVSKYELMTSEQWSTSIMRECFEQMGMDSWLHSLRFANEHVWSNMLILRRKGKPEFSASDAAFLDFAMEAIPFLHATVEEVDSPEKIHRLTPRQRTVMTLLLDGHSRKKIASRLEVSPDTVNDHIKAIFREFHVSSSTELAAIFLRGK
jgi:DNA-binding CsgD family transcriptional regulator